MSMLINRCLLNDVFSMKKALRLKLSQVKFLFFPLLNDIYKTKFVLMLFHFFSHSLFYFNWPHTGLVFVACEIIKYNEF